MQDINATLKVGTSVKLKKSVFSAGYSLTYAGMPSPGVYSVVIEWRQGNQAAAYNLFFPIEKRGFDVAAGHVSVTHVDAESMRMLFQGAA